MATTHIYVTQNKANAANVAASYQAQGYAVFGVGPTDVLQFSSDTLPPAMWNSGAGADWYIVMATKDPHAP